MVEEARERFEEVVARHTQTVYGVALTHTARRADADDVFQEVFAAYWRSQPQVADEEHRKAWLIRTTLNFCLKTTQSSWAKRTVYLDEQSDVDSGDTCDRGTVLSSHSACDERTVPLSHPELPSTGFSFQNEQHDALYAAIRSLSTAQRTVVQLFYFEDLPTAQIASILGEEQGTVKTRLSRARTQLREKLAAAEGTLA